MSLKNKLRDKRRKGAKEKVTRDKKQERITINSFSLFLLYSLRQIKTHMKNLAILFIPLFIVA